jgi:catechol 2,3-dioxygenase-like lactoylglutathione lyase family enzyme
MIRVITATLFALGQLCRVAMACGGHDHEIRHVKERDATAELPSSGVAGFATQHFSLNVADLNAALHFYIDVLGMVELFSLDLADSFKIVNVGYVTDGVPFWIELAYLQPDSTDPPAKPIVPPGVRSGTFSHFGLMVTNLTAAREKMLENDIPILKDIGEDLDIMSPFFTAVGLDRLPPSCDNHQKLREQIIANLRSGGFTNMILVEDPDKNLIELMPPPPM